MCRAPDTAPNTAAFLVCIVQSFAGIKSSTPFTKLNDNRWVYCPGSFHTGVDAIGTNYIDSGYGIFVVVGVVQQFCDFIAEKDSCSEFGFMMFLLLFIWFRVLWDNVLHLKRPYSWILLPFHSLTVNMVLRITTHEDPGHIGEWSAWNRNGSSRFRPYQATL